MIEKTMNAFTKDLWEECRESPVKGARIIADLLQQIATYRYSQEVLNSEIREYMCQNVRNLAEAMVYEGPYTKLRYSRVYSVQEITGEDLEFIRKGTRHGEYVLVGSDDREKLEKHPEECTVGCWGYGIVGGGGTERMFSLLTNFERNRDGMPWGDVSFADSGFAYVRFVVNPYGDEDDSEFEGLPSEKNIS